MKHPEHHIFGFTPETLREWCVERGMQPFRAGQILEWVYQRGVVEPGSMTNLSQRDRALLAEQMVFESGRTVAHQVATDGTQKLLVEWGEGGGQEGIEASRHQGIEGEGREASRDQGIRGEGSQGSRYQGIEGEGIEASRDQGRGGEGSQVGTGRGVRLSVIGGERGDSSRQTECVMIPSMDTGVDGRPVRRTACISSQVGCPVGCRFCASGLGGLDGNLSTGRIVEQVWRLAQLEGVGRISNVVFMGMGEPLANFKSVVRAVRTLAAGWGMGISARKITISTVGMHQAIERLASELELPVTLALSLHAPNDELRRQLIPWAEFTTIEQLLGACSKWFEKTGREITLEYTLLRGVNDGRQHAVELAGLAGRLRANVNLIRFNEVRGVPFQRPATEDVRAFRDVLAANGVNVHIRASRGRDIAAACGQLRHESSGA